MATALFQGPAPRFDQNTLKDYIENGAPFDFILIDIRSAEEIKAAIGKAGCKPYNLEWQEQLQQASERIPKDRHIVIYCQSGRRSQRAAAFLRDSGFINVHDAGGFMTWSGPTVPPSEIKQAALLPEPSMTARRGHAATPPFFLDAAFSALLNPSPTPGRR